VVKPQLQSVPGVAEVNSWGGFERQYHILVDPNRLVEFDFGLTDVVDALHGNVSNVAGGQMVRAGEQTLVRGIGTVSSIKDIEELVVATRHNTPIHVHDIANVVIGHEIRRGAATYNGEGEVVLGLGFMLIGENSRDVTERLAERLEEVRKTLPDHIEIATVYDRSKLVDQVLRTVRHNLFFGAVLVVAVLFAFLGNIRAGLIVASVIPLSLLFAFDIMTRLGIAGSLMSLGAIDFGLVVDNTVIQVENTVRRLSESHPGATRLSVIRKAIMEVRKPTLFGELIIITVYLPILTLQGIEGKLFKPMAITVVLVLVGSLIFSFTVIPGMIVAFLRKPVREHQPRLVTWLTRIYRPVVDWSLRHARAVVTAALIAVIGGVGLFTQLGSEFVPRLSEGTIAINLVRLAGISLEQSLDLGTRVEQTLMSAFPDEVDHIWSRTGTAELATDPMGLELTDVFITLHPRSEWTRAGSQSELVAMMDAELDDLPGQNRVFTQPIEMRINEMIAGIRSDVGIKVFGDDLIELERLAEEIATLTETIEGSADVSVEQLTGQPQLELALDRDRLARYGLSSREVLDQIQSFGGIPVGEVYEGQRRFDLVVRTDTRVSAASIWWFARIPNTARYRKI